MTKPPFPAGGFVAFRVNSDVETRTVMPASKPDSRVPLVAVPAGEAGRHPPERHALLATVERVAVGATRTEIFTVGRMSRTPCGAPLAGVGPVRVIVADGVVLLDIGKIE